MDRTAEGAVPRRVLGDVPVCASTGNRWPTGRDGMFEISLVVELRHLQRIQSSEKEVLETCIDLK